jgi:putative CocE/NonD family hydrolase
MTELQIAESKAIHTLFERCSVSPAYAVREPEEILLPCEDGVRLRTVVYRPETDGAVPVVVMRSCYIQADHIYRARAEEFCARGMAFVYQYCRGTGGSEGVWEPNVHERSDGMCFLNWLSDQSWAGNIGYLGCSYLAFTGWVLADIAPEKVKTFYLTHYGTFRHVSAYRDGLFRQDVLTSWAMENAGFPVTADYIASARYMPQVEVDEAMWGGRLDWYRKWITSTDPQDPYWNTDLWGMMKAIPTRVDRPVFIGEGWYDHHFASAIETYRALPDATKRMSVLRIGAWNHSFEVVVDGHAANGRHFENNDELQAFDWFERILCRGLLPEGRVEAYVIGEDRWMTTSDTSLTSSGELRLYLGARDENGVGTLSLSPEAQPGEIKYDYDPQNPVMTHGAESLLHSKEHQGSLLQPDVDPREDVISFVSEPLQADLPIYGNVRLCLSVASDAEDTAFTFKLMEVMPDGKAYHIRNGITTLGYRNGAPRRVEYRPGERVDITVDSWNIAWTIPKGSRIRLDVASSNFPEYAIHSNHAGIWSLQKDTKVAEQTLFLGGRDGSYIVFPTDG